jgi:hypothetical protein
MDNNRNGNFGYQPGKVEERGYQPTNINEGYQPTTSQATAQPATSQVTSTPPSTGSSVQKK